MATRIRWMLFDADGVLQNFPADWAASMHGQLGADTQATLTEIFAVEQATTMTGRDFRPVLAEVLRKLGLDTDPELVLQLWYQLEVDAAMVERVRALRESGIRCALATNQHNVRALHMRAMPEYEGVFDEQFYSSELGVAKPDPAYFTAIVERLGIEPAEALFVDDRDDNVEGARQAGLQAEVFAKNAGVVELDRILAAHGLVLV
jgi:HAD superfamily hydrolase (TIGR01509 family)